jgi:hypothetical protein
VLEQENCIEEEGLSHHQLSMKELTHTRSSKQIIQWRKMEVKRN